MALPSLLITGKWSAAWYACKQYAMILLVLIGGGMVLGLVVVGIQFLTN